MHYHLISDLHLEFHKGINSLDKLIKRYPHIVENVNMNTKDTILILAGDISSVNSENLIEFLNSCGEKYYHVIYVAGNHEYYKSDIETVNNILRNLNYRENVHFLQKDKIIIDDTVYLGCTLWTDIEEVNIPYITEYMNDYTLINNFTVKDGNEIHEDHVSFLVKEIALHEKIVIITHHLPTNRLIDKKYKIYGVLNKAFYTDLEHLLVNKIKMWICGHTHIQKSVKIGETLLIAAPFGYSTECRGNKIKEVDL